jgi:DNA-binding transcriptional regulator YbjK
MSERPVKRRYDASARRAAAAATRERICAAAEQLFVRDGYARTTIRAVAKAASVAWPRPTRRSWPAPRG